MCVCVSHIGLSHHVWVAGLVLMAANLDATSLSIIPSVCLHHRSFFTHPSETIIAFPFAAPIHDRDTLWLLRPPDWNALDHTELSVRAPCHTPGGACLPAVLSHCAPMHPLCSSCRLLGFVVSPGSLCASLCTCSLIPAGNCDWRHDILHPQSASCFILLGSVGVLLKPSLIGKLLS